MADSFTFAIACLRGRPTRPIHLADVESWERCRVLLPIADVLQRSGHMSLVPVEGLARLAHVQRVAAATLAAERRVLGEVLATLDAAGISVLLLKGAALGYTVYTAPWMRPHSDLDLLVRPGALPRVDDALQQIGFVPAREVTHPLITRQRHFLRASGVPVALDVHDALVNPPVLRSMPLFETLWERRQAISSLPLGMALATPDALLHALVHRVAHHNSSVDPLWLYDMHLLAARMRPAEWGLLAQTAAQSRVCRIAADGLALLTHTLGTDVPRDILQGLDAVRDEPSAALLGGGLNEWQLQWINLRSLTSVRERVELVRAHLAPPPGELPGAAEASWRLPIRYAGRAWHGARKWLRPI